MVFDADDIDSRIEACEKARLKHAEEDSSSNNLFGKITSDIDDDGSGASVRIRSSDEHDMHWKMTDTELRFPEYTTNSTTVLNRGEGQSAREIVKLALEQLAAFRKQARQDIFTQVRQDVIAEDQRRKFA